MNNCSPSKLATKWTQKDVTKNRIQSSFMHDRVNK